MNPKFKPSLNVKVNVEIEELNVLLICPCCVPEMPYCRDVLSLNDILYDGGQMYRGTENNS